MDEIKYIASPTMARFHDSDAMVRGIMGPIGCVSGDTLIATEKGLVRIDEIFGPTRVLSWCGKTGQFVFSVTGGSFPKGRDYLYRIKTESGEFEAAPHHQILCGDGKYRQVDTLSQGQTVYRCSLNLRKTSSFSSSKSLLNVRRCSQKYVDYLHHCATLARRYGQQLLLEEDSDQERRPSFFCAPKYFLEFCAKGCFYRYTELARIRLSQLFYLLTKKDSQARQVARIYDEEDCVCEETLQHTLSIHQRFLLFLSRKLFRQPDLLSFLYSRSLYASPYSMVRILSIRRETVKKVYWDLQVEGTNNYISEDGAIHHNSGKSVACCIEILSRSFNQAPDKNGIRKTRWAIVRNTYPELKSTTIQTWKDWIPEEICPIVYGAPIEAHMTRILPDKTTADMTVYFLALDKPKDVKKLLSLELTGVWINEARELDKSIVLAALSRTSRFPADEGVELTWTGLIMDTNPPDDDHWWYNDAENKHPEGWDFFKQPPAIRPVIDAQGKILSYEPNPGAENVKHLKLGYDYWLRMVSGADPEWIKVHCCGQYGTVFDGKPVYEGVYNDAVHVSDAPLGVFRNRPILAGFDFGLTPACVIGQLTPSGQLRILREYVCERGGIKQFADNVVKPALATLFPNMKVQAWCDPAGSQASQVDETTCVAQLNAMGIPTQVTNTNAFLARRQSVIDRLTRMSDGKPAFIIDPSCKMIRRGFMGGYKFERVQISGEERYKDQPCKNKFSHIADALQYLVQGTDTLYSVSDSIIIPAQTGGWGGAV